MRVGAMPSMLYRDPAAVVEELELREWGCRLCVFAGDVFGRVICNEGRNSKQRGVPSIGHRCKWFKERV